MKNIRMKLATIGLAAMMAAVPAMSMADGGQYHRRQETSKQWEGLSLGSAALGILGFATHNDTLGVLGTAGAVYSGIRYSEDRQKINQLKDRWDDHRWDGNRFDNPIGYRNGSPFVRGDGPRNDRNDRSDRSDRSQSGWRHGEGH